MNNKNLFFTKSSECDAKGFYDSSGFTVLKDSIIATKTTPSFKWNQKRDEIIGNIATLKDNKLIGSLGSSEQLCLSERLKSELSE